jgi:DNA-binding IclR family transcriptional regulator
MTDEQARQGDDNEQPIVTGTQLLDRAVSILKQLGEAGERGAKMSAIAGALELKTSTAHRIISALERHGLIEREHATKRYRLGLALFALGAAAADGTGLRKLCRPALLRLAAETGDTVFLMARSGLNTVCVDRQEGAYMLDSLTGHVGGQIPLGVGPASQAILAFLGEEEANAVIDANAPLYLKYNGLTAADVRARLPVVREQRFALDDGQLVAGISAFAVPILPPKRDAVASIAINMTSARLNPDRLRELVARLRGEIDAIERMINPLESDVTRRAMAG